MKNRKPLLILILIAFAAFTVWAQTSWQLNTKDTNTQQQPQQVQPRLSTPASMAYVHPQVQNAGFAPPPSLSEEDDSKLPSASSALPLLSVIGFGVLLGGIASAMKTR